MKIIKTLLNVEDAAYRAGNADKGRNYLVLKSKQYFDNFLFYFVLAICYNLVR